MRRALFVGAFILAACGSSVPNAGPDQGLGNCFYGPAGIASVPPTLPNMCTGASPRPEECDTRAVCGAQPVGPNTRSLDFAAGCSCRPAPFTELLDIGAQKQRLLGRMPKELYGGCRNVRCQTEDDCKWFLIEPRRCFQLGFLNGYYMSGLFPIGGNDHDGDEDPQICPANGLAPELTMGAQGLLGGQDVRRAIDLRATLDNASFTVESQWCRWYGGPVTVAADVLPTLPKHVNHPEPVEFASFKPEQGQRVSVVGDWMSDIGMGGAHSEIHEVRFGAAIKSDRRVVNGDTVTCDAKRLPDGSYGIDPRCTMPDTWHILASGFFAKDTAQEDRLSITVPVPAPTAFIDPSMRRLVPMLPTLSRGGMPAGCGGNDDDGTMLSYACDPLASTCQIVVERGSAVAPTRDCSREVCPCDNSTQSCSDANISTFADFDQCKPTVKNGVVVSQIALARDVRVDWVDPLDLWNCDCECDDPAASGAVIRARVQGCSTPVAEDGDPGDIGPDERREACEQACGGVMCGGAPNCRIGACRVQQVGIPSGDLIAQMACEPPPPMQRVARAGDYRVRIDDARSLIRVGDIGLDGMLVEKGRAAVHGEVWFNVKDSPVPGLDIAEMKLSADDFQVAGGFFGLSTFTVSNVRMFALNRIPAELAADGHSFSVASFQAKVGARAQIDGKAPGGTEFVNEAPFRGAVDLGVGVFVLDGKGRDVEGHAVEFHLEGTLENHPPSARPGPNRVVECSSSGATSVVLDGTASMDPDPNDGISHYQWFAGSVGVSNQAVAATSLPLGTSRFRLHVYDHDLGSDSAEQTIEVVDTTPPALSIERPEWCVWPPNHAFALFKLGQEIPFLVSDTCDPVAPAVRLVNVEACSSAPNGGEVCGTGIEAVDAVGSGSTNPDIRFGQTTACVRSERAGPGSGRVYRVTIEAVDSHHNVTRRQIRIVVPHDQRGHPSCVRAEGIEEFDQRCEQ